MSFFSNLQKNSEQLYLKIEHVSLDDDGGYECQMLHPNEGAIRAKAFLNIIGIFLLNSLFFFVSLW